jgi:hypothetical protein
VYLITNSMMHHGFTAGLNWMSSMCIGNTNRSTQGETTMAKRPTTTPTNPTAAPSDRDAVIATIAQVHLGLETLESQHLDNLDFKDHACWAIRDALRAAFEAGRKANKRPERKPTAVLGDLILTSSKPEDDAPTWAIGRIRAFSFQAKVYPEHARDATYEIGRSRISKLELRRLDNNAIAYAWDRGLAIPAADAATQAAVDSLGERLADHLYGPATC